MCAKLNYWRVFTTGDLGHLVVTPVPHSSNSLVQGLVPIWPKHRDKETNWKWTLEFFQPVQLANLVTGKCECAKSGTQHWEKWDSSGQWQLAVWQAQLPCKAMSSMQYSTLLGWFVWESRATCFTSWQTSDEHLDILCVAFLIQMEMEALEKN